jgi:hypothetical protein
MKDPVKDKLKRFGLFGRLGEAAFFPTIGSAVRSYLLTHQVDGVEREDEGTVMSSSTTRDGAQVSPPSIS